jgi:hypothetical protein
MNTEDARTFSRESFRKRVGTLLDEWQQDGIPLFILNNLLPQTRLIVGGAPFQIDPEIASRVGVHHVVKNVRNFLEIVLNL